MKIAAVGGWAFANGFGSAGALPLIANTPEEAKKIVGGLEDVAIVLIGESVSAGLEKFIEEVSLGRGMSIVVLRDGTNGNDSGADLVRRSVERATGIKER